MSDDQVHSRGPENESGHGHGPEPAPVTNHESDPWADHEVTHGHGHGHGLAGGWDTWLAVPALRLILAAVVLVGAVTIIGIAALWPNADGRSDVLGEAARLGLATDQFEATVDSTRVGPCSYDEEQQCKDYSFIVHEGPDAGGIVLLPEYNLTVGAPDPGLEVGDAVFLGYEPQTLFYFYADRDRGNSLIALTVLFAIVVVALGRGRGLLALVAMALTVAVLVAFVAPSVLDGNDPVAVAVFAGSAIAFVSLYLTHGFNPTTTVALAGTLASLLLTLVISALFFRLANFSGLATEEGLTLPLVADINLSSLLLGGAIIGALGALDDVTVTQVATVAELHHRNRDLTISELITSGIRVGREHIASTVNTLLLAYAGASMPLLLIFAAADQPLGVVANSEVVAVEIVRTLCGSIGLVAAVPVTTVMAAVLVGTAPTPSDGTGSTAETTAATVEGDERPPFRPPLEESGTPVDQAPGSQTLGSPRLGAQPVEPPPMVRPVEQPPADERPGIDAAWDDFAPDESPNF